MFLLESVAAQPVLKETQPVPNVPVVPMLRSVASVTEEHAFKGSRFNEILRPFKTFRPFQPSNLRLIRLRLILAYNRCANRRSRYALASLMKSLSN